MAGHARQIFIQERDDGGQTTLRFTAQAPVSKKLQGLAAASHDVNPIDRQIASQDAHRCLGTALLEIAEQDIRGFAGQTLPPARWPVPNASGDRYRLRSGGSSRPLALSFRRKLIGCSIGDPCKAWPAEVRCDSQRSFCHRITGHLAPDPSPRPPSRPGRRLCRVWHRPRGRPVSAATWPSRRGRPRGSCSAAGAPR